MKFQEIFKNNKLIPVVVLKNLSDTLPTLKALYDGGIPVAEITFRTECAADAIRLASKSLPDMTIGAGTVINRAQAVEAVNCGAKFIVSPGFSDEIADFCREKGILYIPGCVTPTEIMHALAKGINIIKFFPAESFGGLGTVKSLAAAFPSVKFMPTGGVSAENVRSYLEKDFVIACGGSFMMKDTPEKTFEAAKNAVEIIKNI